MTEKRYNIGQINYIVMERLLDGGYKVQCDTEDEEGNRYLGTMTPIKYISGLASAELTELLIPEEDQRYSRSRMYEGDNRWERPFDNVEFGV